MCLKELFIDIPSRVVVGHITPEACGGGPIALIQDGDAIIIDAKTRELTLGISDKELAARQKNWKPIKPRYTRGVLAKYAHSVTSASLKSFFSPSKGAKSEKTSFS